VLDFGLAKALWGTEQSQDLSQQATVTGIETQAGHIVGTPGYMSPEQARGKDVDKRTDIWAFGCLLYELLTGKRAFQGETHSDTIAAVLEREPDWQALPAKTPPKIRELLRQCLQKDAGRRPGNIADGRRTIEEVQRGRNRWRMAAIAAAALAVLAVGAALWLRSAGRPVDRSQWVQLTNLPDSATSPALSPDGRMLAFIRGPSSFQNTGQIYVKMLPDGQPVQLTHDGSHKMSPVFSPDGTRVAYTTVGALFNWDTWVVPVLGGEPQLLLRNASGLTWTGPRHVLFSEIQAEQIPRMGIVAAEESRIGQRETYLPADQYGMAHRSYLSPDGKWVLLVEMDHDHVWLPCRLVPMDGGSAGRRVGPPAAACTFAAWSPDGKWMYFNSNSGGGGYHIWRRRFPDGPLEQVTSGPTEEEGIAMAADGRSLVTAVTLSNVSIWVHDASGDRQVSLEGNAADPKFTPDGRSLCYRIVKQTPDQFRFMGGEPGEVWATDLKSGRSESLAPGFQSLDYDISADGRQVAMEAADSEGKPRLWVASFDRQSAPRQILHVQGRTPRFGAGDEIFFRLEGFTYSVRADGTGLRKALSQPTLLLFSVSPDGRWIIAWGPTAPGSAKRRAFPLGGGTPVFTGATELHWSPDGNRVSISGGPIPRGRSYIVPLPPGQSLPKIPAAGFSSEQEVASLPGALRINEIEVAPGWSPDVYAFYREAVQRNLYRIPIP
jgi:Tol biopolymer transport system component